MAEKVATLNCEVAGDSPHGGISGTITGNCSTLVFIDGLPVALVDSTTTEGDPLDTGSGKISDGSQTITIEGRKLARVNDPVLSHTGTSIKIVSGCDWITSD